MTSGRADIRLPRSDRSPLAYLVRRVAIAVGLITFTAMIAYLDRAAIATPTARRWGCSMRSTARPSA